MTNDPRPTFSSKRAFLAFQARLAESLRIEREYTPGLDGLVHMVGTDLAATNPHFEWATWNRLCALANTTEAEDPGGEKP
jgi:hypothetical protein